MLVMLVAGQGGLMITYDRHPVDEMRIVGVVGNEVSGDAHNDDSADEVQSMVPSDERAEGLVLAGSSCAVVGRGVWGGGVHIC